MHGWPEETLKASFNAVKQQILDDTRGSAKIKLLYPTWWWDCNKSSLLIRSRKRLYSLVTSTDWLGLSELGDLVRGKFHMRRVTWLLAQPLWGSPVSNMWPTAPFTWETNWKAEVCWATESWLPLLAVCGVHLEWIIFIQAYGVTQGRWK